MRKLIVIVAALALAAGGCGSDKSAGKAAGSGAAPPKAGTTGTSRQPASASSTSVIKVVKNRYGQILVDGRGRALYLFTRETSSTSRCYGACAKVWPVFHSGGSVRAGAGANRHLVGTTGRADGTRQVTYAGHPLYYYVTDRKPGQVTCQNVDEYGGTWLVVAPNGAAIRRS